MSRSSMVSGPRAVLDWQGWLIRGLLRADGGEGEQLDFDSSSPRRGLDRHDRRAVGPAPRPLAVALEQMKTGGQGGVVERQLDAVDPDHGEGGAELPQVVRPERPLA